MTEQLPRPIEPQDIKVGDRVRCTDTLGDDIRTVEFTLVDRCVNSLSSKNAHYSTAGTWTLLYRPEPPREVGSRWRDPETGTEYVKTDAADDATHHHENYRCYRGSGLGSLCLNCDADIIARLERIEP